MSVMYPGKKPLWPYDVPIVVLRMIVFRIRVTHLSVREILSRNPLLTLTPSVAH